MTPNCRRKSKSTKRTMADVQSIKTNTIKMRQSALTPPCLLCSRRLSRRTAIAGAADLFFAAAGSELSMAGDARVDDLLVQGEDGIDVFSPSRFHGGRACFDQHSRVLHP